MPRAKSRTKRSPKRVLALPDLEHAKTAVLNSLTSASGQRTYDHAIREFVTCTVQSPVSRSTVPSSFDTGFSLNNADMRRSRSTFGWLPSGASRTKRPTPDSESRAGGRYPSGEGGATDRRSPRKLVDA
jgi:hypothetical protein